MSETTNDAPKVVGIKQVKQMLQDGKTRKEIAEHYNKSQAEMNATVWQHPELKGLKTKKIHFVEIVEDEEAVVTDEVATEEVAETQAVEAIADAPVEQEEEEEEVTSTWNQAAQ